LNRKSGGSDRGYRNVTFSASPFAPSSDMIVFRPKRGTALMTTSVMSVSLARINWLYGSAVGRQKRMLFLKQDTQDPLVGGIKLSQAKATLKNALFKTSGTSAGTVGAETSCCHRL
jgi:hypothetical protein